jgi:DNA end-binding protein Ku
LSASRPYWKGYLKLPFVSCPVALHPATSAADRVSFRQLNRRTGHRLKHKLVDAVTSEAVDASDKARGYEIGENEFLFVEERDLAQALSERPPPGSIPLAKPAHRESPPTVPAGTTQTQEDRAPEDDEHEEEGPTEPEEAPTLPRAAVVEYPHDRNRALSSRPGRSTRGISRSRITLFHARPSGRKRSP